MALPTDIRTLFAELPQARADRTARAEEQRLAQDALRAELQVAWDWLLGDGQELAAELRTANFNRLELLGPLDEEGREGPWQIGCRALVLLDDGQLEVLRQDDSRALRYLVHTADEMLQVEPAGVTRAFVTAVRTGAIWRRVAEQLRASTAAPVDD